MHRKFTMCTAAGLLALAIACGKSTQAPTSPSGATQPDASAAADGSTLKATAPTIVSPSGGAQASDPLTFVAGKVVYDRERDGVIKPPERKFVEQH